MKLKSIYLVFLLIPSLFSCDDTRKVLLRNYSYFTSSNLTDENWYVDGSFETINELLDTKLPFIIFLTEEGCSSCNEFLPIIKQWAKNEAHLIVKLTEEKASKVNEEFNGLFEQTINNDEKRLVYPTLGIINSETSFDFIDYSKYMKTKMAFFNYMNRNYKTSQIYFTNQNPYNANGFYKVISYNNKNTQIKNLYSTKLVDKIKNSSNKIVISNYEATDLKIFDIENYYRSIKSEKLTITDSTNIEDIIL